jgi:hypothetical protein
VLRRKLDGAPTYRTRTKPLAAWPTWNACAERFVPDWRAAVLEVEVRDARRREEDVVLGSVRLKVSHPLTLPPPYTNAATYYSSRMC